MTPRRAWLFSCIVVYLLFLLSFFCIWHFGVYLPVPLNCRSRNCIWEQVYRNVKICFFCCYEYVVLQECILYFSTLASCDPIPLHGVARARPLLCGLHQNPLCFSQCWPMHLFTFLGVRTPLFVFSCVFVYFAFTYEPPSVLFWPIHLFAFVGVCAQLFLRNCACALFSFGREASRWS